MRNWLAPAQFALTVIIVLWDVVLAGRIAQNRHSPRAFQAISGLIALLAIPGLLLTLATSTVITGRAVATMDWIWPAVLVLFAAQATFAFARGLVNPLWGVPILIYDILIAIIGITRYMVAHGVTPARPLVALLAASGLGMVFATGTPNVLATPLYLNVPMVSPAFPALRKLTVSFRLFMTLLSIFWVVAILVIGGPRAVTQLRNYDLHRHDQLRERPNADFAIGLKILPDVSSPPSPAAIRSDSALVDTMDVDAVEVVIDPGASPTAIDSVARVLEPTRSDSMTVIVAIGYRGAVLPGLRRAPLDETTRLATLDRVMRRLRPDIILPAEDPYGSGDRAVGTLPPERWERYLTDAARVAKGVNRRVRVGLAASSYRPADSTLYAWAARPDSPIDILGFSFFPSPYIGGGIQADTRTADRWMRATPPRKDHWIFATGGFPLSYGEQSQEDAIWEVIAWGTDHPKIKGVVVYEAGDYGLSRGLRAPNGRLRPAAGAVMRALRAIRESAQ